jgi:hypothetical protein
MKNTAQFLIILALTLLNFGSAAAQSYSQDPGHKENAEIAGVKFSVPNSFNLEKSADAKVAFMRHDKYDLALFVAVPEGQTDDNYLTNLSNTLVSQLFPKEKDFKWKILPVDTKNKVSKFQTASGHTKGFNGDKFFQTDYMTVKVKDREVLVGYITQLGQFNNSGKFLFDLKGVGGMSMPGWYAQAHILASLTGEKYQEINPGTVIIGTPVKKN